MRFGFVNPALLLLLSLSGRCQPQSRPLSFEAAVVKVNQSGRTSEDLRPGQFALGNFSPRLLVAIAYHVREDAVYGGPGWLDSSRYDVIAKPGSASSEDRFRMLQTLLAERFKLAVHRDERTASGYALVVDKSGMKLRPIDPPNTGEPSCRTGRGEPSQMHLVCRTTMTDLAAYLPHLSPSTFDLPVVDQTGLNGAFEFKLDWAVQTHAGVPGYQDAVPQASAGPGGTVTLLDALRSQLGLKLERRKIPLPIVIVDHVEKPLVD